MRVLLVAPRGTASGVLASVDAEVSDIVNSGLDVDLMNGDVSAASVLRRVRENDYDCLWLATHGNGAYIELSGDEKLLAEELVPLVRGRFSLVVLNTCNSLRIAKLIQLQANVGVICTLVAINDGTAYKFGSLLSSALVEQPTVADAYLATVLGNDESYLYLPALRTNPSAIESLAVQIQELNEKVTKEIAMWRWLFVASAALHVPEWIAIVFMWSQMQGG